MRSRVTAVSGRAPGLRVSAADHLPRILAEPSGDSVESSPLTVTGAAAEWHDEAPPPRSLLIPCGNHCFNRGSRHKERQAARRFTMPMERFQRHPTGAQSTRRLEPSRPGRSHPVKTGAADDRRHGWCRQRCAMSAILISEIFGPTVQGEGALIGKPTVFVRTGGCDFRCNWCDTLYAALPAYRRDWLPMTPEEILSRIEGLTGGKPLLVHLSV